MESLKHYSWEGPGFWIDLFIWPDRKWRWPRRCRWTGVGTVDCGRFSIAAGWHWPPRVPV